MTFAVVRQDAREALKKLRADEQLRLVPDPALSRSRRDRVPVFHAFEGEADSELATVTEHANRPGSTTVLTEPRVVETASFQPVWEVHPGFGSLGYELFVIDDNDASEQLDFLHASLSRAELIANRKRSQITICPRAGWQGYGPAIRRLRP